jgi:hypothetical protein
VALLTGVADAVDKFLLSRRLTSCCLVCQNSDLRGSPRRSIELFHPASPGTGFAETAPVEFP